MKIDRYLGAETDDGSLEEESRSGNEEEGMMRATCTLRCRTSKLVKQHAKEGTGKEL